MEQLLGQKINEVISTLERVKSENHNPNIKEKINLIITYLNDNSGLSIKKAIYELDQLVETGGLSNNRTEIWSLLSILESLPVFSEKKIR